MVLTVLDQVAMIDLQLRPCLDNGQYLGPCILDWETLTAKLLTAFSFSKNKANQIYVIIESKIYKAQIFCSCVCPGDLNKGWF